VVAHVRRVRGGVARRIATVGEHLHPRGTETITPTGAAESPYPVDRLEQRPVRGHHVVEDAPGGQITAADQPVEYVDVEIGINHLAEGRDTCCGEQLTEGRGDVLLGGGRVGLVDGEEGIDLGDEAGRLPGRIELDDRAPPPSGGTRHEATDLGQLERTRVEDRGVSAQVQDDRYVGTDRVEFGTRRRTSLGDLLVEEEIAVADQPLALAAIQARAQRVEDIAKRLAVRYPAVDSAPPTDGQVVQMDVGIDEAGHDQALAHAVHRDARRGCPLGHTAIADLGDAALPDEQCLGIGRTRDGRDAAGECERGRRRGHATGPDPMAVDWSSDGK